MRTEEEIKAEIARLLDVKDRVIIFDIEGNPYHETIDAQIEALKKRSSIAELTERYQEYNNFLWWRAVNARLWCTLRTDEPPSQFWENIAHQATRKMSA